MSMNIKNRIKGILFSPNLEWEIINNSNIKTSTIIVNYLLFLVGLSSVTLFTGLILKIGFDLGIMYILKYVLVYFILVSFWFIFISLVINKVFLFGFKINQSFNETITLIIFGSIPILVFSIVTNLFIYSSHLFLTFLSIVYSLYIIWQGLLKQNKLKDETRLIISVVYGVFILTLYFMFRFFNEYI